MSLCCIYHKTQGMRVVEDEDRDLLVASGDWFDHPNQVNEEVNKNEKPIRQQSIKRCSNGKDSTKSI
jgi:hypothetical protein